MWAVGLNVLELNMREENGQRAGSHGLKIAPLLKLLARDAVKAVHERRLLPRDIRKSVEQAVEGSNSMPLRPLAPGSDSRCRILVNSNIHIDHDIDIERVIIIQISR